MRYISAAKFVLQCFVYQPLVLYHVIAVVMETEDLGLRRLFRPSVAHLSVKEQLKLCPPRDLGKTKLYRTAAKIWGSPKRTRVLVARSEPEKEIRVNETAKTIAVTPEKSTKVTEKDEIGEYRQWMEERRKLRGDLDSLGLSETWLRSKRNKTETEKRVLEQMMRRVSIEPEKKVVTPTSPKQKSRARARPARRPRLDLPLPDALAVIDDFVQKNRLRLVDLFARFDKDKNWRVSKAEFRRVFKIAKIPVNDRQLDNLVLALDKNEDNTLDYRELVRGRDSLRKLWRKQERGEKIDCNASPVSTSSLLDTPTFEPPPTQSPLLVVPHVTVSEKVETVSREVKLAERKRVRRLRQKKEKAGEISKKEVGSVRLERHCAGSTVGGAFGEAIDAYRETVKREYERAVHLCRMYGIAFSKETLEKALLHVGDRSVAECRAHLRQPGMALLSRDDLVDPDSEYGKFDSRSHSSRRRFSSPLIEQKRVKLSTGWARVRAKTDCWLTYDEYEALTRDLRPKFEHTWKDRPIDTNAFWPGSLLDCLRVYLPASTTKKSATVDNVFTPVTRPLRNADSLTTSYLDSGLWPMNDAGYVQHGGKGKKQYQL